MRKISYLIAIIILTGCSNAPSVVKTGLEGKAMPSFVLLLQDSLSYLNTSTITEGKPVVFFSFSPHCPYCKAQTEDIISHIDKLNDVRFYLITTSPFPEFRKFCKDYDLGKYKNIIAGIDTSYYFAGYFQSNVVPVFAIYDQKKKLKQVLQGKTSINLLKDIA